VLTRYEDLDVGRLARSNVSVECGRLGSFKWKKLTWNMFKNAEKRFESFAGKAPPAFLSSFFLLFFILGWVSWGEGCR